VITERYRFYCGLADSEGNEVAPRTYFDAMDRLVASYTVFYTGGVWRGAHEKSIMFEVVCVTDVDKMDDFKVRAVASQLRLAGNQESVLATIDHCVEAKLIS